MSDNVGYTPGVGATIAADDIGGVLYQRVKMIHGAEGNAHETADNNPMPIKAMGELIEVMQDISLALQSLNRTIGLAQVNPTTGRLLVDGSSTTQPISGNLNSITSLTNLTQIGGANANSVPISLERGTADNLLNFITIS